MRSGNAHDASTSRQLPKHGIAAASHAEDDAARGTRVRSFDLRYTLTIDAAPASGPCSGLTRYVDQIRQLRRFSFSQLKTFDEPSAQFVSRDLLGVAICRGQPLIQLLQSLARRPDFGRRLLQDRNRIATRFTVCHLSRPESSSPFSNHSTALTVVAPRSLGSLRARVHFAYGNAYAKAPPARFRWRRRGTRHTAAPVGTPIITEHDAFNPSAAAQWRPAHYLCRATEPSTFSKSLHFYNHIYLVLIYNASGEVAN